MIKYIIKELKSWLKSWFYIEKPSGISEIFKHNIEKIDEDKDITEEDIRRYYRMYSNKFDMDNMKQWNTEKKKSYESYKKNVLVLKRISYIDAWRFMISQKTDMFIGIPVTTFISVNDYDF